ncbi:MAG: Transcription termination protein NusB [Candidatus Ozemobacter sibiricus]|jgi:N utilization substance protein B|uniref:Transcription antitermination protein NusB n=1 Tax=Candidatus Ozemobacter sibiricus TaxID=2268124 RepID=A0A367ZTW2_9BACT|nr:MAG: Transcription termination protein NusB [Candidatus Ozemobacter sibiricus]
MSSRRRKSREAALKALYQADLVGHDPLAALTTIVTEEHLQPALESLAREFILSTPAVQGQTAEIESFIDGISALPLEVLADAGRRREAIEQLVLDSFHGPAAVPLSSDPVKALLDRVADKVAGVEQLHQFARDLVERTQEHRTRIDGLLSQVADHWSLDRMASLDRAILRFATCELLFFPDVPVNVTINEAIEIARKYSTDRSGEFVNGILDKIKRDQRPEKYETARRRKGEATPSASGEPSATDK